MYARRFSVNLSAEAQTDYDDILLYGLLNWGNQQTEYYKAALDEAIERLRRFLEFGARRDELCPGCRAVPIERHVIYYRVEANVIQIIRIIHGRSDAAHHLPR
jgi:toxin ParE1/3/4